MTNSPSNPSAAVLITGATGGLGRICAVRLAATGRPVIVHGRRSEAVDDVVREIEASGGSGQGVLADLSDLVDVRRLLDDLAGIELHGIMANAGITTDEIANRSAQGFDLTFAVNVLAHQLLLDELSAQILDSGRLVIVSSGVHDPDNKLARRAGIPIPKWSGVEHFAHPEQAPKSENLNSGRQRYANSKLCNILQARSLQCRFTDAGQQVDVFALDPGLMVDTDLAREAPAPVRVIFRAVGRLATPFVSNMRLSTTTAEVVVSLFEDTDWNGKGFAYLDGPDVATPSPDAQRDDLAEELWADATALIASARV